MDRHQQFNQLLKSNPTHYMDRGKYISKKMRKRMTKQAGDNFYKIGSHAFESDMWNSKFGRQLRFKKKKQTNDNTKNKFDK